MSASPPSSLDRAEKLRRLEALTGQMDAGPATFRQWYDLQTPLNRNMLEWNGIGRKMLKQLFTSGGANACDEKVLEAVRRNNQRERSPPPSFRYKTYHHTGTPLSTSVTSLYVPSRMNVLNFLYCAARVR